MINDSEIFLALNKQNKDVALNTKEAELNNWKQFNVYEKVQNSVIS